ncbi:Hypothetical predicted protein [Mytilus galloprovincialis]|uniref:Uncharacterized protein n=1 Tax=Mytilus galloprovincialis TaxID=29158 RepID=A0A8B6E6Y7_MYTGA|nr:Hypothetical predicted protein [Mytilus galloprovincialis]
MTDLTKRLACIRNSVEDRGRRFFHYFFYKLLGEIQKFHVKKHTHGDLGESKNESNILLQKTEAHSVAVRLIDPGDVNHRTEIDLADISTHMCTIGRECSFTEDPIFNRFIKGKSISTEKQAEDLRQELSKEGETFESDRVYSKKIIDAIFDEPKDEAPVQSLGNIRDMVSGAQGEKGDTGEPGPMEAEDSQGPVGPRGFRGPKGDIGITGLPVCLDYRQKLQKSGLWRGQLINNNYVDLLVGSASVAGVFFTKRIDENLNLMHHFL